MINWESTRWNDDIKRVSVDIGPYCIWISENPLTCSASIYTINNHHSKPATILHLADVEAAKKAAIDWIRNDLWNTLGEIGVGATITTGGTWPGTSGTVWLKPYPPSPQWIIINAQHNS